MKRILVCALLLLSSSFAARQSILLTNGDVLRLSGSVTNEGDVVRIESPILGILQVNRAAVSSVTPLDATPALAQERAFADSGLSGEGPAPTGNKVAVSDFQVSSANAELLPLGKGFSELIAYEIRKSPKIRLVDREQRKELLKEAALVESGLVADKDASQVGRVLSCDYIVFGEVVDMGGSLVISLRMTSVVTGEVVWRNQLTESRASYPYISAFFAKSILGFLRQTVDVTTERAIAQKRKLDLNTVVRLSKGLDAFDRKDLRLAKAELDAAKKEDPNNEVADAYLSRLSSGTAKFKTAPERTFPFMNPAYMSFQKKDRLFVSGDSSSPFEPLIPYVYAVSWGSVQGTRYFKTPTNTGMGEGSPKLKVGYTTSLPRGWGFGIEGGFNFTPVNIEASYDLVTKKVTSIGNIEPAYLTGQLMVSKKLGPGFSLGLTALYQYEYMPSGMIRDEWINQHQFGGSIGLLAKNEDDSTMYDFMAGWNTETRFLMKPVAFTPGANLGLSRSKQFFDNAVNKVIFPLQIEQTLTFGFNKKRTFFALKQVDEIYLDNPWVIARLMPMIEHWFADWISVRLGVEGSVLALRSTQLGYGATAGLTLRIPPAGLDLDLNWTLRQVPSQAIEDWIIPQNVMYLTITKNGVFKN